MATHDYIISNASGAAVRADLNNALAAIATNNSSATEPTTTYAYQWWADTGSSPTVMKLRNAANSGWITLFQLDGEWTVVPFENGTAAAPSIYFKDSGTDTGIYSPGADQVAITTGGTGRLFVTSSGSVGIGSSTPGSYDAFADDLVIANGSGNPGITLAGSTTGWGSIYFADGTTGSEPYRGYIQYGHTNDRMTFATAGSGAMHIDSSQRVGIGSNVPNAKLTITETANANAIVVRNADTNGSVLQFGINTSIPAAYIQSTKDGSGTAQPLAFYGATSEMARFDTSSRFLLGTSSSSSNGCTLQVRNSNGYAIEAFRSSNDSSGSFIWLTKSRGTEGSPTEVSSGDTLGGIAFRGYDGATYVDAAYIYAECDGTWTDGGDTTDNPSRLVFSTTADGASSPTERMRITNGGFLKASSTGGYGNATGGYHEIRQGGGGNEIIVMAHTASSGPYGINLAFTGASPNDTTSYFLYCGDSTAQRATIRSNGGLANYSANNANLSDRNAKKDISPAADTWDCIKEWEIVNYRYKDQPDDADLNLGVIAQQVAESCPEVITVFQEAKEAKPAVLDDDGNEVEPAQEAQPEKLGIKEQQMYWMAIKALQEAQVRIEQLEAKVAALESA